MKKIIISSLFFVLPLGAANYIDNPNFDSGVNGWSGYIDNNKLIMYHEHVNRNIIHDQHVASCTKRIESTYSSSLIWFEMSSVPNDAPLYFSVEFGSNVLYPVTIQIELVEILKHPRVSTSILSKKTVQIIGNNVWHVIASDYPAYKREKDTRLILEIRQIHEKSSYPTPDEDLCTQVNYAQVGTDPKALGGRGARKKNFTPNGDL